MNCNLFYTKLNVFLANPNFEKIFNGVLQEENITKPPNLEQLKKIYNNINKKSYQQIKTLTFLQIQQQISKQILFKNNPK